MYNEYKNFLDELKKKSHLRDLKNFEDKDEKKDYIRQERFYGSMERKFYVGDIDESKVSAEFKDGVLKVCMPKETIEKPSKTIEIK